jgi:hypothetical protein
VIELPAGVVRADGAPVSEIEATALAVLALAGVPNAPRAALGSAVLGAYSPASGWGDGRANLVCMQAVLELFRDPLPARIAITLRIDGKPVATGTLQRERARDPLTLHAVDVGAAGAHRWQVVAEPAVPGLGFSLALTRWVAWPPAPSGGVELAVTPPVRAALGVPASLAVQAQAPAAEPLSIDLQLPAGVQADRASLEELVEYRKLVRFEIDAASLRLWPQPLSAGEVFAASVKVIPTLRGQLQSGRSALTVAGTTVEVPPARWTID